jgi:serine/threonine-protein kinase
MAADDLEAHNRTNLASDSFVSRSVVDAKLASAPEVQACLAKQKQLRAAGRQIKLAELLVKAGVVTKSQLRRMANPAEDSASQSLQQIPGFQILQKIGAGAMASVYKARQLSLDRIVAIKILPKRLSEDPSFVERFEKEGRAAAKLSHNNIVQAIDVGEYAGYHYFVMEYVDGQTVYDEVAKLRRYSEERALNIAIQIARALEHAHARGLIHRDVKPKNIIITKDGTAKLADMGLAREAGDAKKAAEEKGRAYGTPYYISPEQIRGVVDVDFRADIYSLGATIYHMITGRVPFEGPNPAAIMHKHLKEALIPPDHLNSAISTGLAEVVERSMAKDRHKRYQSTGDLLSDLELVQRGEAPLQARAGYDDKLLQDLAGGAESEDAFIEQQDGPLPLPPLPRPGYLTPMILGLILQFIVILVLAVALLARP